MRVSELIAALQQYPADANARAYEGEVCGVVVESADGDALGVIYAHETDSYTDEVFARRRQRLLNP